MKHIAFTKKGYEDLKNEKEKLETKRKKAVEELTWARDLGDRSENGAYKAARWKLSSIDRRLRHVNKLLDKATVVAPRSTGEIDIGSHVIVKSAGKQTSYEIVGGYESDLSKGRISHYSPLGNALKEHKKGECIEFNTPSGKKTIEILDVV